MMLDPPGLLSRAELPNILDNVTMIETYYDNMWESQCWAILTAEKHRFLYAAGSYRDGSSQRLDW